MATERSTQHGRGTRGAAIALAALGAVTGGLGIWVATVGAVAAPVAGVAASDGEAAALDGVIVTYVLNGTPGSITFTSGQTTYPVDYDGDSASMTDISVTNPPTGWRYAFDDKDSGNGKTSIVFTAPSGSTYTYVIQLRHASQNQNQNQTYGIDDLKGLTVTVNSSTVLSVPGEFDPSQPGKTWGIRKYAKTNQDGTVSAGVDFKNIPSGWTTAKSASADGSTSTLTITSPDSKFSASYSFTLKVDSGIYDGGNENGNTNSGETLSNSIEDLKNLVFQVREGDGGTPTDIPGFDYREDGPFDYKGTGLDTKVGPKAGTYPSSYKVMPSADAQNGTLTYTFTNQNPPEGQTAFSKSYTFRLVKDGDNGNTGTQKPTYTAADFAGMKVSVDGVERSDFDPVNKFDYPDFYNLGQSISIEVPALANTYWTGTQTDDVDAGYQGWTFTPKNGSGTPIVYRFYFKKGTTTLDPESPDQLKDMKVSLNGKEMTDFDPLGKTEYTWEGTAGTNSITVTNKGTWNVEASNPVNGTGKIIITATSPSGKSTRTYTINIVSDGSSTENGNNGNNSNTNGNGNTNLNGNESKYSLEDLKDIIITADGQPLPGFQYDKQVYTFPADNALRDAVLDIINLPEGWKKEFTSALNPDKTEVHKAIHLTSPDETFSFQYSINFVNTTINGNNANNDNSISNNNGNQNQNTQDDLSFVRNIPIVINDKVMGNLDPDKTSYEFEGSPNGSDSVAFGTGDGFFIPSGWTHKEGIDGEAFVLTLTSPSGKTYQYSVRLTRPSSGNDNQNGPNGNENGNSENSNTGNENQGQGNDNGTGNQNQNQGNSNDPLIALGDGRVVIFLNGKRMPFDPTVRQYDWTGNPDGNDTLSVTTSPWKTDVQAPHDGSGRWTVTFTSWDGNATASYTFNVKPATNGNGDNQGAGNGNTQPGGNGPTQQQGGTPTTNGGSSGDAGDTVKSTITRRDDGTVGVSVTRDAGKTSETGAILSQTGDPLTEASIVGIITGVTSTVAVIAIRRRRA